MLIILLRAPVFCDYSHLHHNHLYLNTLCLSFLIYTTGAILPWRIDEMIELIHTEHLKRCLEYIVELNKCYLKFGGEKDPKYKFKICIYWKFERGN